MLLTCFWTFLKIFLCISIYVFSCSVFSSLILPFYLICVRACLLIISYDFQVLNSVYFFIVHIKSLMYIFIIASVFLIFMFNIFTVTWKLLPANYNIWFSYVVVFFSFSNFDLSFWHNFMNWLYIFYFTWTILYKKWNNIPPIKVYFFFCQADGAGLIAFSRDLGRRWICLCSHA